MNNERREETIERQDKKATEIEDIQCQLEQYEFEMAALLHQLPAEELFNNYFADKSDKKDDPQIIFQRVADFWLSETDKARQISEKLNSYPEYNEFINKQKEYEKLKVQYYVKLYLYWKMIDKDRKSVFDASYRILLDQLADRGWFLYFLQTPDIPIEGTTVEDAEQVIEKMYGDNNCIYFSLFFKDIITVDSKNELRKNKANDLREALECLMNGAYQSCARTMFALLENEHVNASSLEKRSRGVERADEITKYVKETGSAFYKKIWSKLNKQYKQLNCDTDKMNHSNINRNDLAHGKYIHIATKVDCMKLMFLYATFKELSFYLQTMVDYINDFKKGLLIHIIDEISKQQSKE